MLNNLIYTHTFLFIVFVFITLISYVVFLFRSNYSHRCTSWCFVRHVHITLLCVRLLSLVQELLYFFD